MRLLVLMRLRLAVLALAWLIVLAGCATVADTLTPVPTAPTLVGKWKGEWGGTMLHPIEMVVEKQQEGKVGGTMTVFPPGSAPSTLPMRGIIGAKQDGSLWAILEVQGRTSWDFPLRVVSERRLEGTGRSPGHFGPVTLNRE